jgi:hypothetical protein
MQSREAQRKDSVRHPDFDGERDHGRDGKPFIMWCHAHGSTIFSPFMTT